MKDWTIRRRIWTSFAVILALMTVTATIAYTRLARIEQLTSGIETDILPRLNSSNQIMVERMANYSLTQEYVLETDRVAADESASGDSDEPSVHGDARRTVPAG